MTLTTKLAIAAGILTAWGIVAVTVPAQVGLVALLALMVLAATVV